MTEVWNSLEDRVRGLLLGLAAGDFHGGPIRMAVRLAESLVECSGFDRRNVLDRYLDWYRNGAFDTGPVAERVFERVVAGEDVDVAVAAVHVARRELTAGCNPSHRCGPLAMSRNVGCRGLSEAAMQEASLTHFDPLAGDVSAATVVLARGLIEGLNWHDALNAAADGRLEKTQRALQVVDRSELNRGGFAPDVLAAAIFFLNAHETFSEALSASVTFAGNWNFCPVLVGAIGGARWGSGAVSLARLENNDFLPRIQAAAEALGKEW